MSKTLEEWLNDLIVNSRFYNKEQHQKDLKQAKLRAKNTNSNLKNRIISGVKMVSIFLLFIFFMRPVYNIIMCMVGLFMIIEWDKMTVKNTKYRLLGYIIIPISIASILCISHFDQSGFFLLNYFVIIWTVDSMAMFGGKYFKGPKLAPKISPNKTISGLIVGVVCAVITSSLTYKIKFYIGSYTYPEYYANLALTHEFYAANAIFVVIIGCLAQMSDLFVSIFKRKFDIKDTGDIIPGHGGVLDRFDSIILTAPVVAIFSGLLL